LALALIHLEQFAEAGRRLAESQRIRQNQSEESTLALAGTLGRVALLHRSSGDYFLGVPPLESARAIRRRVTPEHPEIVALLQIQGDLRFLMGDIRGGQEAWAAGIQLAEKTLRPAHPAKSELLRRLGLAAFSIGNLTEARQLRERALRIGELSLAPCDPAVTALLTGVANSRKWDGELAEARTLYRRALWTVQQCADANHSPVATDAYATALYNEAGIAREIGDLGEADRLYQRAVQVWSQAVGPSHPFVARGLDSVAEVAASRGQLERARLLYERALTIRRLKVGDQHPDVAWTLTNLAQTSADSGHLTQAARYVARALEIFKRVGPSDEPDHLARVLALRGDIQSRGGNYLSAQASFAEALSTREQIFGRSHPLAADSRAQLAAADLALGSFDAALTGALDAERAGREHLQFTVRYLPERQAMAYSAKRPRALDLALSVVASESTAALRPVYDAVIQSRGVILDELAARAKARDASDPHAASLSAAVIQARQRFANLVVRSLQEHVSRAMLDEAREQKEDAERTLAESSAKARAEMGRADVRFKDVETALPPSSALLSFVIYDRSKPVPRTNRAMSQRSVRSYGAFVHRAGTPEIRFVTLGSASWIDGLVRTWRQEASGASMANDSSALQALSRYRTAGTALRRAVWDPVRPQLDGAERIFIVPDGLLNIVNIAALPERNGRYLVEGESVIHYLSTERDARSQWPQTLLPFVQVATGSAPSAFPIYPAHVAK
jgi:tetratricopeptide (TPR) repeat protein